MTRFIEVLIIIANHFFGVQPDPEVRAAKTKVLKEEGHPHRRIVGGQRRRRAGVNRAVYRNLPHPVPAFVGKATDRQDVA